MQLVSKRNRLMNVIDIGDTGRMTDKDVIKFILWLFGSADQTEMFGIIDTNDGLRKAGFRAAKIKEFTNGDVDYKVTVNETILRRWLGE